jgi:hypothetical protein
MASFELARIPAAPDIDLELVAAEKSGAQATHTT